MITRKLLSSAVLLASTAASIGATVTFTSSTISATDTTYSFLNNTGTLVAAYNFGPARNAPYTYNAPTTASNPNPSVTLNGITFVSTAGATTGLAGLTLGGSPGYDSGRFSNVSQTNTTLYGLVYDGLRSGANTANLTLNLTGLSVGQSYQLQMVYSTLNFADNPANTPADRSVAIAAGLFTAGSLATNGTGSDGTTAFLNYGATTGALYVSATFTADATSELFTTLSNSTGGNSRVTLSGVVISVIPEPSTHGLVAVGALGFAARRRRSQGLA